MVNSLKTSASQLVEVLQNKGPGARRAAARLMSLVTDDPKALASLAGASAEWPQPRLVLGVTGAPGSGKSTLVDHLVAELRRRYSQRSVGVVAVDPSSPFTGGALLGDRVRMMRHATDPGVMIRSLASRGHLGGLALGTRGVIRIMGLAGCEIVIVETVGVGQSEVEVARNADLTMVVLAPGNGDSVQLLKAGLMEAGDLFVVNKADREGAARLHQQLLSALAQDRRVLAAARTPAHTEDAAGGVHGLVAAPPATERRVYLCSAGRPAGIERLVDDLETLARDRGAVWQLVRRSGVLADVRQAVVADVAQRIETLLSTDPSAMASLERVMVGKTAVSEAADQLMLEVLRNRRATCAGHPPGHFRVAPTQNTPVCEGCQS